MIAPATTEDLPEIIHLQRLAFREEAEHVGDMGIKPIAQTLEELRTELEGSVVLKYVQDGEIVGSVRARMERGVCAISRLVVRPDHWGRGIGRRLMEEIESRFPDAERYELFTRADHERNRPFYRSLGYEPFQTERHSDRLTFVHVYKPGPAADRRPKE